MKKPITFLFLSLVLVAGAVSQVALGFQEQDSTQRLLERKIPRFEVVDALLRDGISELSLTNVEGVHLGFEEISRDKIQDDPRTSSAHFSLHLEGKTLGQVLDALCQKDPRYTWSVDGSSINVYPRAAANDPSYFLDQRIQQIRLSGLPDPDQALTPLFKLFPEQQIGYFGGGGDDSYAEPWTTVLERLAVRQFINRIAERVGNSTVWVWQGGKDERMFTFFRSGFHTFRPSLRYGFRRPPWRVDIRLQLTLALLQFSEDAGGGTRLDGAKREVGRIEFCCGRLDAVRFFGAECG